MAIVRDLNSAPSLRARSGCALLSASSTTLEDERLRLLGQAVGDHLPIEIRERVASLELAMRAAPPA